MEGTSFPEPKKPEAPASRVEVSERKLKSFEELRDVMIRMSQEINSSVKKMDGLRKLLGDDCRLRMDRFALGESGGIHPPELVQMHLENIEKKEIFESRANDPVMQEIYKREKGVSGTPESVLERYRRDNEERTSGQTEMAVTALLHKVLKGRFVVVRASQYDDYENGMDNLILDRETGAVICAFDEVLVNKGDDPATSKKRAKMEGNALANGKKAKYGIALEDGKLVRSELENIPVFCLSLGVGDLYGLAEELHKNFDKDVTKFEQDLYARFIASIEEQKKHLESLPLRQEIRANLQAFGDSLEVLKGYAENKYSRNSK